MRDKARRWLEECLASSGQRGILVRMRRERINGARMGLAFALGGRGGTREVCVYYWDEYFNTSCMYSTCTYLLLIHRIRKKSVGIEM